MSTPGFISLVERVRNLSGGQLEMVSQTLNWTWRGGVPSIYRVQKHQWWKAHWQCEWDDATELGAFRSYSLGRAVRRAQRARRDLIIREAASAIEDRLDR